jgi:5-methylthioribose kinase
MTTHDHQTAILDIILAQPSLCSLLGIDATNASKDQLKVQEVGDGNLNFVYIVTGPNGVSIVAKQAVPYIRVVGEGFKLTRDRVWFERNALVSQFQHCPAHVPEVR